MPGPTRATRITGRLMSLKLGSVNRSGEVSKSEITESAADSGFLSMDDAAVDLKTSKLAMTIAQDLTTGSLHRDIIENVGDTVAIVFAPYRNEVATADQPHIVGNAVIRRPEGVVVGGETSTSATGAKTIDVEWDMPDGWTLDDGTP